MTDAREKAREIVLMHDIECRGETFADRAAEREILTDAIATALTQARAEAMDVCETLLRLDAVSSRAKDGRVFVDYRDWEPLLAQARALIQKQKEPTNG